MQGPWQLVYTLCVHLPWTTYTLETYAVVSTHVPSACTQSHNLLYVHTQLTTYESNFVAYSIYTCK